MRAKDFLKEDHGFLAPGSHDWEGEVGKNIWNYLKNLPGGAIAGVKNVLGIEDKEKFDQEDPVDPSYTSPNLAKSKVQARARRKSDRTGQRLGRTSRIGGEDDQ